MKNIKTNK